MFRSDMYSKIISKVSRKAKALDWLSEEKYNLIKEKYNNMPKKKKKKGKKKKAKSKKKKRK